MTSRACQCDVKKLWKFVQINSNHVVLATWCLLRQSFRIRRLIQKVQEIIDGPSYVGHVAFSDKRKNCHDRLWMLSDNPITVDRFGALLLHAIGSGVRLFWLGPDSFVCRSVYRLNWLSFATDIVVYGSPWISNCHATCIFWLGTAFSSAAWSTGLTYDLLHQIYSEVWQFMDLQLPCNI